MAESAALLVDDVFPKRPVRQQLLSFAYPLRFLVASRPTVMGHVLGIVFRWVATHLIKQGRAHTHVRAKRRGNPDAPLWQVWHSRCAESQSDRGPVHFRMFCPGGRPGMVST